MSCKVFQVLCFLALSLIILQVAAQRRRCRVNEQWTDCGSSCPARCAVPQVGTCSAECVPGCFCKPGYVLNANNTCVLRRNCKPCGVNEEWTDCGSSCPPTCALPQPGNCIQVCKPGCFCKSGYLRSSCGRCVLRRNC